MLSVLFAVTLMTQPVVPETKAHALELCRPKLQRSAGGEIQTIDVRSVSSTRSGLRIAGRLTAFLGMGPPATGEVRTHHLIRAQLDYECTVRTGRVRHLAVKPLQ